MIALAALAGGLVAAATVPLPDPSGWEPKVFVEDAAGPAPAEAAVFTRTVDGGGRAVLSVGPWLAGAWSARFETRAKLPYPRATIRGRYRTFNLLPLAAEVRVTYWHGDSKLGAASLHLATATVWTAFAFPARHPAHGADRISIGVGLSEQTAGSAGFSGMTVEEGATPLGAGPAPRTRRPAPPAMLQRPVAKAVQATPAAPRWWLAEANGAWWLVSPEGRPAYASGVNAPAAERAATLAWLDAHGFNALDGWSNVWAWAKVLPETGPAPLMGFQALESGTMAGGFDRLVDDRGETTGSDGHAFPDPFDPRFEAAYRSAAQDVLRAVAGKPWFAAWFADNEVSHADLPRHVWSPGAGRAFVAFLEAKYGSIDAVNRAWGKRFKSFEALRKAKPEPALRRGALWEDQRVFAREIVKRYVDTTLRVLHEADPGRLVFSNRFMLESLGDTLDVLDPYAAYDGIAVNCYPANLGPGLSAGEREALTLFHQRTGKPVLIGEWSVPAIDSGLYDPAKPLDWSWNEVVDTQAERAAQAARVAADFHDLPFVVGAHWFIWKDVDTPKRRANRGLFKADGTPWPELAAALGAAQRGF